MASISINHKLLSFTMFLISNLICFHSNAQTAKEMMEEIKGTWTLDDNGNVTYMRVIELPGMKKDEIYLRASNYFTYNYVSGKSVIQTQDKEQGLLVGKGIYDNVHVGVGFITTYVDAWHIMRVDVKEEKARVIITLTEYDKKIVGGDSPPSYITSKVKDQYPINEEGPQKVVMTKAFYRANKAAINSLDKIEKAIKEGSTSKSIENSEW